MCFKSSCANFEGEGSRVKIWGPLPCVVGFRFVLCRGRRVGGGEDMPLFPFKAPWIHRYWKYLIRCHKLSGARKALISSNHLHLGLTPFLLQTDEMMMMMLPHCLYSDSQKKLLQMDTLESNKRLWLKNNGCRHLTF